MMQEGSAGLVTAEGEVPAPVGEVGSPTYTANCEHRINKVAP